MLPGRLSSFSSFFSSSKSEAPGRAQPLNMFQRYCQPLVCNAQLAARIDSANKTLHVKESEKRAESFRKVRHGSRTSLAKHSANWRAHFWGRSIVLLGVLIAPP